MVGRSRFRWSCLRRIVGWSGVGGLADNRRQIDAFSPNFDVVATEARDIHELVDETQELLGLRIDRFIEGRSRRLSVADAQQVSRVRDRRQWVA